MIHWKEKPSVWLVTGCTGRYFDNCDKIFVTHCTENCHIDNYRRSHWRNFRQNDNISVAVSQAVSDTTLLRHVTWPFLQSITAKWELNVRMYTCENIGILLNVRGPSYLGLTRSISWLLMPWPLTSPGHQQPWYWLCRICRSWYLKRHFEYLCHTNVE